ncbi:MAG: hypothetical protein A2X12_01420 [Bacteroidetes bacterium GWE2_29_8]|nr:MAG: hypothetical protein A2X12_01420 [Bacteroidetes bacterium GWE2_29_8]OFY23393.1 MAG: hypothetical protein A2X02_08815 [Bacteroidetes bacterium GWF2_29_10]
MKKFLSLSIVALFAIGFVACKKDHTCACTYTYDSSYTGVEASTYEFTIKDTKKKATDACEALSSSSSYYKYNCVIK